MAGWEFEIRMTADQVMATIREADGERQELEPQLLAKEPNLETAKVLEQWLKRWQLLASLDPTSRRLLVPGTFSVLGLHLWKLAFDNEIGDKIREKYADATRSGQRVRVRIGFDPGARELASLPWEFVKAPIPKDFFLASKTNLVLGRFVHGEDSYEVSRADQKVRVLLAMSLPADEKYKVERAKFEHLAADLTDWARTKALEVRVLDDWDAGGVEDTLAEAKARGEPFDVVHLTAMTTLREGELQIDLPQGDGQRDWTGPDRVVAPLSSGAKPTVVVLHLCESQSGEWAEHFEWLAPDLIGQGIPAVLAMRYPMSAEGGHLFLTSFYGELLQGRRIGEAVQAGRKALRSKWGLDNRHWATPVLYMQSDADGSLLHVEDPDAPTRQASRIQSGRSSSDLKSRLLTALREASGSAARQPRTGGPRLSKDVVDDARSFVEGREWPDVQVASAAITKWRRDNAWNPGVGPVAQHLLQTIGAHERSELRP